MFIVVNISFFFFLLDFFPIFTCQAILNDRCFNLHLSVAIFLSNNVVGFTLNDSFEEICFLFSFLNFLCLFSLIFILRNDHYVDFLKHFFELFGSTVVIYDLTSFSVDLDSHIFWNCFFFFFNGFWHYTLFHMIM